MEYLMGQRIEERRRHHRIHRPRTSYLSLSEEECRTKLRLSRQAVTDVCHLLASDLGTCTSCPYALPVAVKVTAALHFYAHGSFQHPLGFFGGLSQSTVSSAIHAVTSGLVRHAGAYIRFPVTAAGRARARRGFASRCGLPGVLGVLGCTHVQLRAPPEDARAYVNRSGTHSVNIQVICDAACTVTHALASLPGSSHDASVLARSAVPALFQDGGDAPPDGCLLGHEGYPLKTWLITPYATPTTAREVAFNARHAQARALVEETLGSLKTRFRCLNKSGGALQYSPRKVGAFFVACCVLHNIATRHGCVPELSQDALRDLRRRDAEPRGPSPRGDETCAAARARRDRLALELSPP